MFKPLLCSMITLAAITFACPAFGASASFQLSVTVPAHAMPSVQAAGNGTSQELKNNIPQITQDQVTQQEQVVRQNQTVTVRSVVVL